MNEKIMVVDDEPNMLALLEIVLRRKGYTVLSADGAYQALALLAQEKPDLFILDVMMPGVSGLELCQRLRARPDTARTPVIMLSGRADSEAVQRGMAAGANEYSSVSPGGHASAKDIPLAGIAATQHPAAIARNRKVNRITRLEDNLAWAATTYRELSRQALNLAAAGPLTPAAFRDATSTSRKYVLVILEDLDRRGLLRRTDAGHVLGPKTLALQRSRPDLAGEGPFHARRRVLHE